MYQKVWYSIRWLGVWWIGQAIYFCMFILTPVGFALTRWGLRGHLRLDALAKRIMPEWKG